MTNHTVLEQAFSGVRSGVFFTRRPDPIPGDLRISWRVATAVLILRRCRGNTANLEQIHVLTWALRSYRGRKVIHEWFLAKRKPNDLIIRHDPSTARTINLAVAGGLAVRNSNSTISLTGRGERLAHVLWGRPDMLAAEKDFLSTLPARITQRSIRDLLEWGE